MKLSLVSMLTIIFSSQAFASQSLSTKVSNHYYSIRALGMGNAFTAVADDYSLMFYNPAGFARKPYNEVQITLLGAGVSSKTLTIANDLKTAGDTVGTDTDKANAIDAVLQNYYGQTLGGKLQALEMFWVRKGWGIGFIPIDLTIDMSVNRQLGPALDLNVKGDTVLAAGYGTSLNNEFDVGFTAKYLNRIAVEQSLSAIELAANSNVLSGDRFKEGQTIDFDIGVMWTPNWFAKNTSLDAKPSETAPAPTPAPEAAPVPAPEIISQPEVSGEKKVDEAKPADSRTPQSETVAEIAKPESDVAKTEADKTNAAPSEPVKTESAVQIVGPPADDAGVVKLGEEKPPETKETNEVAQPEQKKLNQGAGYPLTLGATVHNVIGGNFTKTNRINKNATEAPTKMERVLDLGAQYRLVDMEDFKIRAMLDIKNVMQPGITANKMLHAGLELDYSPGGWFRSQIRGGMNQGYYTAGATLMFLVVNLEFATYGEEVGSASNKIENRVVAAKLGFNF